MDLQQDRIAAIPELEKLKQITLDAYDALPRRKGQRKSERGAIYRARVRALNVAIRTIQRTLEAENDTNG